MNSTNSTSPHRLFDTIYEDGELLVVNKPSDLVCHPTKGDLYSSLISRVRLYLGADREAHLVNRLDRETSGLVVVAKSSVTARNLRKIWEERSVRKEYLAIVYGSPAQSYTLIDAPLGKAENSEVAIKDEVRATGAAARTEVWVEKRIIRREGEFTLVRAVPFTGRKHQIRIHLAHIGHPIVGDKLYGLDERFYLDLVHGRLTDDQRKKLLLPCQALHAERIEFEWRGRAVAFRAEAESWFQDFLSPAAPVSPIREP